MTDTLNWRCPPRTTHKIALPKKVVIPLNFCTDELACHNQFSHEKNPNPYPSFNMFIFRKANKCVVQSDSRLKCFFSPKFRYKEETGCIPLMHVSIFSYQNARWSFHSKQLSLWHHGYRCFSIQLSYFDQKMDIVSFFGKNLPMSPQYNALPLQITS